MHSVVFQKCLGPQEMLRECADAIDRLRRIEALIGVGSEAELFRAVATDVRRVIRSLQDISSALEQPKQI